MRLRLSVCVATLAQATASTMTKHGHWLLAEQRQVLAAWLSYVALALAAGCDVGTYYSQIDMNAEAVALKHQLNKLVRHPHKSLPYTDSAATDAWDALTDLDRDPSNFSQVLPIYGRQGVDAKRRGALLGAWSPEHVFLRTEGVSDSGQAAVDLHCLHAADSVLKALRGSRYFDECSRVTEVSCIAPAHEGAPEDTSRSGDEMSGTFMPPAVVRGDIARSLFYLAVRYDGTDANTVDF